MKDLGTIGGSSGEALGIHNRGEVVGQTNINGISHAFVYSGGVMHDLGTLGGTLYSSAYAINDTGEVVGASEITGNTDYHAFLYNAGVMMDLGTLNLGPGPFNDSVATAINKEDQVAGYAFNSNTTHSFLYSNGVMTDLGTLGGATSAAFGINDSGEVVGDSQTTGNAANLAFLY